MKLYRGYKITHDPRLPVTGTWRAERFGVSMSNNSERSIKRMVDAKVAEAAQQRKERSHI